mgnify:CR=1 FL=1
MGTVRIAIVYFEWVDAHGNTGWFSENELEKWAKDDWYCNDVGFLVKEEKGFLVLAQRHEPMGHANGEEQWGGLHRIPKTWIRNRRILGYMDSAGSFWKSRK